MYPSSVLLIPGSSHRMGSAGKEAVRPMIAVLGLGEMGLIHARGLSRVRAVRLALASGRSDVLDKVAQELCADAKYSTYADAIADPDVSGVVIATSPPSHPSLIVDAANAGKFIFSEKPLGYSTKDIVPALRALRENHIQRFMTGFMRRWDTGYRRGLDAVNSGEIGKPAALKCTSGDASYPEKYRRPGAGAEHSMLKDLAVHDLDLARWLLQSEIKRAYASTTVMSYPELASFGDCDLVMAVLEMENGARACLHLSRSLDYGYNVTSEVVGTRGTVQMGETKFVSAVLLKSGQACTGIAPSFPERFADAFEAQMEAFARIVVAESDDAALKIMKENPSYASAEDGLRVTEVAEALMESERSGKAVDVRRTTI